MTILTATGAAGAIRYTPEWLAETENPPVFLLRAGNVLERELMEAELAGEHLAGTVWPWEMQAAIEGGIRTLGGDDAEELVAIAQTAQNGDQQSDQDKAILAETLTLLAQHWPPYKLLLAQQHRRTQMIPIVAFRRFCVGWENIGAPFKRGIDRLVTVDSLSAIDPLVLRYAGGKAWRLQQFGGDDRGNSDAPSKSGDAPETSSSGAVSPADGSSTDSDTSSTPA